MEDLTNLRDTAGTAHARCEICRPKLIDISCDYHGNQCNSCIRDYVLVKANNSLFPVFRVTVEMRI